MKKIVSAIGFSLLVLPALVLADIDKKVEKTFAAEAGGKLLVDSDYGSVTIRSHASNEVLVKVSLRADTNNESRAQDWFEEFELRFDDNGKDVSVYGEMDWHWNKRNRLRVAFDIAVPEVYDLRVETGGGSLDVNGVEGQMDLRTSGGSIDLDQLKGNINAKTSGGSVRVEDAEGDIIVGTSGGSIRLRDLSGDVEARTSGGSIEARAIEGDLSAKTSGGSLRLEEISGNLEAGTSGGSIYAELIDQISSAVELRTSAGRIELVLPENFQADIDAATTAGGISTELPVEVSGMVTGRVNNSSLRGKINGGGSKVYLRTSAGGIRIKSRS